MENKQLRLLTWLSAALLALVAVLVFVKPPEKTEEGAIAWSRTSPDATSDAATAANITLRGGVALSLQKSESGWTVAASGGAAVPADAGRVSALLDAVLKLEVAKDSPVAPAGSADLAAFGLDSPVAEVQISLGEGQTVSLRVGADAPVGYSTYVQTEAGGPVLRARAKLSQVSEVTGLDSLRAREITSLSRAQVTGLLLEAGAEPLRISRDDHGWWLEASGGRARADEARVNDLIDALIDARAEAFLAPAPAPDSGALRLAVSLGEDAPQIFTFAPPAPDGARAAWVPAHAEPVTLRSPALDEALSRPAADWLDPHLLPVRGATLTDLDLSLGEERLHATRTGDGWSVPQAEALLAALGEVRVDRAAAAPAPEGEPWGALGLAEGESRREGLRLFQEVEGGRVAQDELGGPTFLLPTSELRRLLDAAATDPADAGADEAP